MRDLQERFWSRVTKTDTCWLYGRGPTNAYRVVEHGKRRVGAHRLAVELALGIRVPPDMHVHHTCGVKACVRPDHLKVLTPTVHGAIHAAQRRRESNEEGAA